MLLLRKSIFIAGLFFVFVAKNAVAERPTDSNAYSYLVNAGQVAFSKGGGAFLPMSVLQSLQGGSLSPVMQFVVVNQVMNQCIQKVLKEVPFRREPYIVANKKFARGYCKIRKCFNEGILLQILPQMSSNPSYGGSEDAQDRAGAQAMGLALAQAFNKEASCESGADNGMDPSLIAAFGN